MNKIDRSNKRKRRKNQVVTLNSLLKQVGDQIKIYNNNADEKLLIKEQLESVKCEIENIINTFNIQSVNNDNMIKEDENGENSNNIFLNNNGISDDHDQEITKLINKHSSQLTNLNKILNRLKADSVLLKNLQSMLKKIEETQTSMHREFEKDKKHEQEWLRNFATEIKQNYDPLCFNNVHYCNNLNDDNLQYSYTFPQYETQHNTTINQTTTTTTSQSTNDTTKNNNSIHSETISPTAIRGNGNNNEHTQTIYETPWTQT